MKKQCISCPFGPDGDKEVMCRVMERLLRVSQTCHHSGGIYKPDTHICRGARDWQLTILHRMGILPEPTDAAWTAHAANQPRT